MDVNDVIGLLEKHSSESNKLQMAKFGIKTEDAIGVKVPDIRKLAKTIGMNNDLAVELWNTGIHEARMLASMITDPQKVSEEQIDEWVACFDSWDLCDVTCDMIGRTSFVVKKIEEYSLREEEFVKRTAFALMCELAFYDKDTSDEKFYHFFYIIEREAWDERNFVKKSVNWALRQIGKRNDPLRLSAISVAERVHLQNTSSARWIARDAIRELTNQKVIERVIRKTCL